jgi:hypothetical protein
MTPAKVVCAVVAVFLPGASSHAAGRGTYSQAELRADEHFASYAYAHEFGSGVYDFNGHTLQVYGLPFGWQVRELDNSQGPGVRLKLPVTLGFLDFQTSDVLEIGLPTHVDSVSFVPGIELDFRVGAHWRALPYVQAGLSTASSSDAETRLFGTGLRGERDLPMAEYDGLYATELAYSRVDYRDSSLPNDDFVRWRNGVQFSRGTSLQIGGRQLVYGLFGVVDYFLDPPTGPATGVQLPTVQLEAGVVFDTRPEWKVLGMPVPRLGLSYRFAGDLSSVRLVIGAPF